MPVNLSVILGRAAIGCIDDFVQPCWKVFAGIILLWTVSGGPTCGNYQEKRMDGSAKRISQNLRLLRMDASKETTFLFHSGIFLVLVDRCNFSWKVSPLLKLAMLFTRQLSSHTCSVYKTLAIDPRWQKLHASQA